VFLDGFDAVALLLEGEPGALSAQATGVVVAAAQGDDVLAHFAEESPALGGLGLGDLAGGGGVTGAEPEGEGLGDGFAVAVVPLFGVLGEAAGDFERFLLGEPIAVAALAPVREVLPGDGWLLKSAARMAWTSGWALSHGRILRALWPSSRRELSSVRMGRGRRAILPVRFMGG